MSPSLVGYDGEARGARRDVSSKILPNDSTTRRVRRLMLVVTVG